MSVERLHTLLERMMYACIHFTQITFSCMLELDRTKNILCLVDLVCLSV